MKEFQSVPSRVSSWKKILGTFVQLWRDEIEELRMGTRELALTLAAQVPLDTGVAEP